MSAICIEHSKCAKCFVCVISHQPILNGVATPTVSFPVSASPGYGDPALVTLRWDFLKLLCMGLATKPVQKRCSRQVTGVIMTILLPCCIHGLLICFWAGFKVHLKPVKVWDLNIQGTILPVQICPPCHSGKLCGGCCLFWKDAWWQPRTWFFSFVVLGLWNLLLIEIRPTLILTFQGKLTSFLLFHWSFNWFVFCFVLFCWLLSDTMLLLLLFYLIWIVVFFVLLMLLLLLCY